MIIIIIVVVFIIMTSLFLSYGPFHVKAVHIVSGAVLRTCAVTETAPQGGDPGQLPLHAPTN